MKQQQQEQQQQQTEKDRQENIESNYRQCNSKFLWVY